MSSIPPPLTGRLPVADYNALIAQQRRFFDEMASPVVPWADASDLVAQDAEGGFIGPFNPALRAMELGRSVVEFHDAEVHHSVLTARTRDVIIMTVGSFWQADDELCAHSAVVGHADLPENIVISLEAGVTSDGLQPGELIAYR